MTGVQTCALPIFVLRVIEESAGPTDLAVELEVSNILDPLALFHALSQVASLEVEWLPDENLMRDQFRVRGTIDRDQVGLLAVATIPNVDELVASPAAWREGGRGFVQLVSLYATSARLRMSTQAELAL